MLHHAVFFNRPSEACWDSRESGILENLGSGILYTYLLTLAIAMSMYYNKTKC